MMVCILYGTGNTHGRWRKRRKKANGVLTEESERRKHVNTNTDPPQKERKSSQEGIDVFLSRTPHCFLQHNRLDSRTPKNKVNNVAFGRSL